MISLEAVRNNFDRRAQHLVLAVASITASTARRESDRIVASALIELESAMSYVVRSAFIAGGVGGWTAGGRRLRASYPSVPAALCAAAVAVGNRTRNIPGRDEPPWASSSKVITVAANTTLGNAHDITSAMGIFPSARKCVKAARNFFAHRAQDTLDEVRSSLRAEYGLALVRHPTLDLIRLSAQGPASLLEMWIWNYVDIVQAVCG